jgi:plastocyanin
LIFIIIISIIIWDSDSKALTRNSLFIKPGVKMRVIIFLSTLFMFISGFSYAQTMHIVEVSNNVFTPSNLTIEVNDTVRWINMQGFHNVVADDGSFTSGAPSSDPWVYDNVFTSVSSNPYFCEVHGNSGGIGMSGVVTVQMATSVAGDNSVPNEFELKQNYPNPFNPSTRIQYTVPESGHIKLTVYNSIGEEVALLVNGIAELGSYEVAFNAADLTSGIYFYKLKTKNHIQTRKMILIK